MALPSGAADQTVLRRVTGQVGYTQTFTSPYIAVTGNQSLDPGNVAVTLEHSQGLLELPDSSLVGLGASSRVQIRQIAAAAAAGGTQIEVPVNGGGATIRFDIKHPAGGTVELHF